MISSHDSNYPLIYSNGDSSVHHVECIVYGAVVSSQKKKKKCAAQVWKILKTS